MNPWPGTATEEHVLYLDEHEDRLCELVHGTLVEKAYGLRESVVGTYLIGKVVGFANDHRLGFVTGASAPLRVSGNVRLPGLMFFGPEVLVNGQFPRESIWPVRPRLLADVLRQENTTGEMRLKIRDYFEAGADRVWIVNLADETVSEYDCDGDLPTAVFRQSETFNGGNVLPGFEMAVDDLFAVLSLGKARHG